MPDNPTELRIMTGCFDWHGGDTHQLQVLQSSADEIERLRALVLIGDVRCEKCFAPATTIDMGEVASCADCLSSKEPKA